jgi:hypothetical protein
MDEDDDAAARKFFEESERLKRGANRLAAERANQNSIDAALAQIDEEVRRAKTRRTAAMISLKFT